ncbi:pentatricopeptide repeat-containing protein At1g61870, mitochondrial-like [Impatiens glandulifera]|uniref:pentatricopeptide repeat-containing protein At1g61870, mitochondrial-like n=1 Tax=Impatiens glandulifera TaxID=253017 RepID=UPI001FB12B0B|nr:pentatricopeptide repeat-containing protein At1g61870, mitochondrial-like [Impatiens glandulifera]
MGFLSKIRFSSSTFQRRSFSSILNPDSTTPLSSKQKTRAALSLIKTEKNPERILDICRAASLTPDSQLDRIAFSVAITKLAGSNYFEGIRTFLEELKTRPDLRNERFLSHAIVLYGQAGMIDNAILTFDHIKEFGFYPSAKSLNALIFSCIVAHKYDEAKRVYLDFPKKYGIERNLDTYNTVIKAFCESGSASSVYSVLAEMERNHCKPNLTTFSTLIAGFYKEEKYDDVGKVLEMMKKFGMRPNISLYNTRIQSLCKLRKSKEAKALLDGMISRGMKPNNVTYTHLIHGFCREGNLEESKNLFKTVTHHKLPLDSECYFTLVYYLCQGGDYETALQITKESMEKNWIPNFTTMKTLVNGLGSISKVDEAKELVAELKKKFPTRADVWIEIEEGLPK